MGSSAFHVEHTWLEKAQVADTPMKVMLPSLRGGRDKLRTRPDCLYLERALSTKSTKEQAPLVFASYLRGCLRTRSLPFSTYGNI